MSTIETRVAVLEERDEAREKKVDEMSDAIKTLTVAYHQGVGSLRTLKLMGGVITGTVGLIAALLGILAARGGH